MKTPDESRTHQRENESDAIKRINSKIERINRLKKQSVSSTFVRAALDKQMSTVKKIGSCENNEIKGEQYDLPKSQLQVVPENMNVNLLKHDLHSEEKIKSPIEETQT